MANGSSPLNAGIGGPPPRPYSTQNFGPYQSVDFSFTSTQQLTSYPLGGDGGSGGFTIFYGAQQDLDNAPGYGSQNQTQVGVLSASFQWDQLNQHTGSLVGTVGCNGTLVSGNPTWVEVAAGGTDPGDTYNGAISGSAIATHIDGNGVKGTVTFSTSKGLVVFENATLGLIGGEGYGAFYMSSITVTIDVGILIFVQTVTQGAPDLSESLALDQMQAVSGTPLALTGENGNYLASALQYQTDGTSGWHDVTDFSPGNDWTGTGPNPQPGSHYIQVRDTNNPGVLSNIVYYFVKVLSLNNINNPRANTPINIQGTDYENPVAPAMQYQVNQGGPWVDVTDFVPASATGQNWSGVGPAEQVGTYILQVRNTAIPGNVSNLVQYIIGNAAGAFDVLPVWSLKPNWLNGVLERLEWLTDVLTGDTGAEQRLKLRLSPRRTFEYEYLLQGRQRQLYDLAMKSLGTSDWYVPIWHELYRLVGGIQAGVTTTFAIDTVNREFVAGGLILFYNNAFFYEVAQIASVTDSSVTLVSTTQNNWSKGQIVLPLMRAAISEEPTATRMADQTINVTMAWMSKATSDWPAAWGTTETFQGYPVLTQMPDEGGDMNTQFQRLTTELDPTLGLRQVVDTAGYGFATQQYAWLINGYDELAALRSFFYALAGRLTPLWVSTMTNDMGLAHGVLATDTTLTIGYIGYTTYGLINDPGRQNIRLEFDDGSSIYLTIVSSVVVNTVKPNGNTETTEVLTLSGEVGLTFNASFLTRISFISFCRQDADLIEIQHEQAGGLCSCTTIFREAPDLRVVTVNLND